ncbi:unnamed protein product [Kluyveromyces dobzhanskii CBS 2104]|uniref:SPS-sensor serine protease component SSY5 n=1 Tax=Kluyveromyces dobzhanskii CBS 2104 TaxID=1427455 RepID=A0A0A8L2A7_9SACH|nr:unnamed protein product [Kluyveromyces dobzhanskii CBS 2104]
MVSKFFGFGRGSRKSSSGAQQPAANASSPPRTSSSLSPSTSSDSSSPSPTRAVNTNEDLVSQVTTSMQSSSIFSKGRNTFHTGASSTLTDASSGFEKKLGSQLGADKSRDHSAGSSAVGKPLRVLDYERLTSLNPVVEEEDTSLMDYGDEHSSSGTLLKHGSFGSQRKLERYPTASLEALETELKRLNENLIALMDDIHQNVTNVSKTVIQAIEFFKKFLPETSRIVYTVTMANSAPLRSIAKMVSHFVDNLLNAPAFQNSRSILLKAYLTFLQKLNINVFEDSVDNLHTLPTMKNFAVDDKCGLPNMDKLAAIVDEIVKCEPSAIADQDRAFIAPILRGLSRRSAILTVMFGLPNPQQEHHNMVKALFSTFADVHFFCVKDYIKPCAETLPKSLAHIAKPMETTKVPTFVPPFRVPTDALSPPISLSISTEDTQKMTGTLGGYLYPKISEKDPKFAQFSNAAFAVTCAHVVLSENQDYPFVSAPSAVLQTTYKKSLMEEREQYSKSSPEYDGFNQELQRVESNLQWQRDHKFGQVVWGERSVINKSLSDFAIIKVNSEFSCENFLGEDLNGLPDPALRFKNLYVTETVENIKRGANVFKIGATSKYTTGKINGSKLIYWADNRIQSTEFVVSSPQPLFANAGDSGAWLLTRLDGKLGLGVAGMLHSYDGELKQFGLFTPISTILERLKTVTGVEWDINPPAPKTN